MCPAPISAKPKGSHAHGADDRVDGVGQLQPLRPLDPQAVELDLSMMAGRIPVSAARDGIFFPALARLHPRYGTPHVSLIVATLIGSLSLGLHFTDTTLGVFDTIVQLSVLTTLLPHLYTAAAEWMLRRRGALPAGAGHGWRTQVVAMIAFAFVLWSMYGIAPSITRWAFLVILAGIPLYIWFKTRR